MRVRPCSESPTQGGTSTQTTVYIDGIFEHTIANSDETIPNLQIGSWRIGYGKQNMLHVLDDASRIATIRIGDPMGDSSPAIKFNLEDHLGSSNLLLDANSSLISKEEYYPFGETSLGAYSKKRYRFCGKEKDEESGLYYFEARYYNPWTCRFINIDPLAAKYPFYKPYQYAGNKPINFIDLDGAEPDGGTTQGGSGADSPPADDSATGELGEIKGIDGVTIDGHKKTSFWDKVKSLLNGVGNFLGNAWNNFTTTVQKGFNRSGAVADGIRHQWIENNALQVRRTFSYAGTNDDAYEEGRTIGNILSIVQGIAEMTFGGTATGGGAVASGTGVLTAPGIIVTVGGAAITVHGAGVASNAMLNMTGPPKDDNSSNKNDEGDTSSGNDGNLGDEAAKEGLTSAQMGKIIGWGEKQSIEAVQQTINVTKNLTKSQVQEWAKQGLTKSWVQDQLTKYSSSLMKGGDKLKNTQLMHRKELMEKILELW